MIKIKLFFLVFFLFAFQLSFSSTQNVDVLGLFGANETENKIQFEIPYFAQNTAAETPRCQLEVLNYLQPSKCFLSNFNSKDFQVLMNQGNLKNHAVRQGHLVTGCASKNLLNVPIYLQTEKFRL